jgi:hypothetical protein
VAAATSRTEFSKISIPEAELISLGRMLVDDDAQPLTFYPIQLIQLSTMGPVHNMAPIATSKTIPSYDKQPEKEVEFFRFYFDGLIVHIHRNASDPSIEKMNSLNIGNEEKFAVVTIPFEESFQDKNLSAIISDAYETWPELVARLHQ